ncbi:MAG: M23 family metallopeptidase, partial [Clostridiales bacterium]|nr:M23 family metallopeptidase [Clostridiales bacterium]
MSIKKRYFFSRSILIFALSFIMLGIISLTAVSVKTVYASSTNWCWPTSVHTIGSDWPNYSSGSYHGGTDFAVALNSPVYSSCDGEVVAVTTLTTSYGKHIKIKATVNGSTVYIRYCHLNSFAVSVGDKVTAGQLIAYSGSTGNSTGPHLHYEVRNANDYYGNSSSPNLNPKYYLPGSSYYFETINSGPVGNVDEATGGIGTLYVKGWAYDPDTPSESLEIHVYIYNTNDLSNHVYAENLGVTNTESNDINNAYGISGNHRFSQTINLLNTDVVDGNYRVDFYAIGTDSDVALIGSQEVAITGSHSPTAKFESAEGDYGMVGTVRVTGWAFDRDAPSSPVEIHMYIGGEAGSHIYAKNLGYAELAGDDVNNFYSQYGLSGGHRFDFTVNLADTGVSGTQNVYLYAIDNYGIGDAITLIGSKTVTITENNSPKGWLDTAEGGTASLHITGWAFDP